MYRKEPGPEHPNVFVYGLGHRGSNKDVSLPFGEMVYACIAHSVQCWHPSTSAVVLLPYRHEE